MEQANIGHVVRASSSTKRRLGPELPFVPGVKYHPLPLADNDEQNIVRPHLFKLRARHYAATHRRVAEQHLAVLYALDHDEVVVPVVLDQGDGRNAHLHQLVQGGHVTVGLVPVGFKVFLDVEQGKAFVPDLFLVADIPHGLEYGLFTDRILVLEGK